MKAGDRLVQPQLADTLRLLAREGTSAFYRGEISSAIVEAQKRHSVTGGEGRMTLTDLAAYDVVVRPASHLDYRGYDVYSAAPSSSGRIALLEAFGLLEDPRFPIGNSDAGYAFGTRNTIHAMVEALRLALADRDACIGDPAFFPVPETQLLSDAYLRDRSLLMNPFPIRMAGTPAAGAERQPWALQLHAGWRERGTRQQASDGLDLIDHHLPLQQAVDASRIWLTLPNGSFAWNFAARPGAPTIRQVCQPLQSAADDARLKDAASTVVARP